MKRFINADILAGVVGQLGTHNLFVYCLNNPVNNTDAGGNMSVPLLIGVGVVAALKYQRQLGKTQKVSNSIQDDIETEHWNLSVEALGIKFSISESTTKKLNEAKSGDYIHTKFSEGQITASAGYRTAKFRGVGMYSEINPSTGKFWWWPLYGNEAIISCVDKKGLK